MNVPGIPSRSGPTTWSLAALLLLFVLPESGEAQAPDIQDLAHTARFGTPDEFGAMVAFIASDRAGYTTGANIRVDGGSARGFG